MAVFYINWCKTATLVSAMDNNTIIGYNILAKRAIETESGVNIDEALRRITAYRVVRGEGEDYHPAADVTISTKIIYYTKTDKGYLGWIWVDGEGWVCAGGVSDSWKAWSEDHGSSATGEHSVYIGEDNISEAAFPNYQLGHDNLIDGEVLDTILDAKEDVSLNLGSKNIIHGEGINLGKKNTTDTFGITIGQRNVSHGAGIAIGEDLTVDNGSFGIGKQMRLESGSYAIGSNYNNFRVGYGSHLFGSNNSGGLDNGSYLFGGCNTLQATYGSIIVGQFNTLTNSSAALTMIGLGNRAGDGDGPYNTVAIGNYNDIKGSSAVALGIGAGSKNCSIAISGKGTNSELGSFADSGSIAIGNRGVYAYYGSASMGTDGVSAHDHSVSIGNGGVSTYCYSYAFGKSVCSHNYSMSLGMDGCYSWEQSIAVGRSGAVALDRSMVFGRDGLYAYQRGIAIGHTGAESMYHALAVGIENVKGKFDSVAVGRAGVYATTQSVALGNGGYARASSMSILNLSSGASAPSSFSYKVASKWNCLENLALFHFYGKDGRNGYVDVKLTGIQYNRTTHAFTINGSTYSYVRDIPFTTLGVAIRGTKDDQGNISPYYVSANSLMDPLPATPPDTWVDVTWGSSDDKVSPEVDMDVTNTGFGASDASFVIGNAVACAKHASVAISLRSRGSEPGFSYDISSVSDNTITITQRSGTRNGDVLTPISVYEASADNNSLAVGSGSKATNGSTSIGVNTFANRGSMALGYGLWSESISFGTATDDSLLISSIGYPTDGVRTRGESFCNSIAIGSGPYSSNSSQSIGVCTTGTNKSTSIGYYSRANDESIAIGDENESKYNAIGIGTRNLSSGWSIALGVNNTSYDGLGGHATMIGYNNTSTANQEYIHKSITTHVTTKPTAEQIATLNSRHSAYRTLLDPYLDESEIEYINEADQGNNSYFLGYSDEIAWGTYSYLTWLESLGGYPPYIISSADKATLDSIFNTVPQTLSDYKTAIGQALDVFSHYTDVSELSASVQAATTMDELQNILINNSQWQILMWCYNYQGEPQPGRIPDRNVLNQVINAYRSWSSYGLDVRDNLVHTETIDDDVSCNNVLLGASNTAQHYNSILIGASNTSLAPLVQPDERTHVTDDDGYTLAVGYRNTVGRNYDIAIGFMSTANGGENVAIQHSSSTGYRNLTMFDSTASGTGNIAVMESTLTFSHLDESDEPYTSRILHNTLSCGTLDANYPENYMDYNGNTYSYLYMVQNNTVKTSNVQANTYYFGYNDFINADVVRITAPYVTDNYLIGNMRESNSAYNIRNTYDFSRNFIFLPEQLNSSDQDEAFLVDGHMAFSGNVMFSSKINMPRISTSCYDDYRMTTHNFLMHSEIYGNPYVMTDNILFSGSIIRSSYYDKHTGCSCISNNLLINSYLTKTNSRPYFVANSNFMIGTTATDCAGTMSISDGGTSERDEHPILVNVRRSQNFGDNTLSFVGESMIRGNKNIVQKITDGVISGFENKISGIGDPSYEWLPDAMNTLNIFGSYNRVAQVSMQEIGSIGHYVNRNYIFGSMNRMFGEHLFDNYIFGGSNILQTDFNVPRYSGSTIRSLQGYHNSVARFQASEGCNVYEVLDDGTFNTYNNTAFPEYGVFYYDSTNKILGYYKEYMSSATSMSFDDFVDAFNNGTIRGNTFYYLWDGPGSSTLSSTLYTGTFIEQDTVCNMYYGVVTNVPSEDVGFNCRNERNFIMGSSNILRSQINGYAIIGSSNEVKNSIYDLDDHTLTKSNGFVQGNNNVAMDGSNIICMGNGNLSVGHNSVAIGSQLISSQWQTVIGKYNIQIAGTNRLASEDPQDPTKALFIIGNGYSTKDDESDWNNEQYITRSNAMVVYADGTVKASAFESDNDLTLDAGTGLEVTEDAQNRKVIVSLDNEMAVIANHPGADGKRYVLECNNGVLSWVEVGLTTV